MLASTIAIGMTVKMRSALVKRSSVRSGYSTEKRTGYTSFITSLLLSVPLSRSQFGGRRSGPSNGPSGRAVMILGSDALRRLSGAGRIEASPREGGDLPPINCRKIRMRRRLWRTYAAEKPDDAYVDQRRVMLDSAGATVLAAVFNLNHSAHTVDWHFIHLSVSNVVVIGL